jgi:hypothetical protein
MTGAPNPTINATMPTDQPTNPLADPKRGGYPKNVENPDEWAAFLARYLDNRVTNGVHDGIGLVALHIVDAIKEARGPA